MIPEVFLESERKLQSSLRGVMGIQGDNVIFESSFSF